MKKRSKINFWYIALGLLVATALLWFFIDVNKPKDPKSILVNAEAAAKPINSTLNENAIENIKKRKDISDDLLKDIKTYQTSNKK